MKFYRNGQIKICHCRPGDAVRLVKDGVVQPELYIIAVNPVPGKKASQAGNTYGLYKDERPLFLVNLENGHATPMPHLSSRIIRASVELIEIDTEINA